MKFLSRLDDFEHIVIDGSVSGTGLSSLYLKDTATPILRIGNNTGDSFITYDGSELSISSDVDLRLTTPTDQDVFLITSSGNITTTQAGGTFTIGGGLTLEAITGGFLKADANGVVSVDNSTYLTSESDTLDSVTDRGATTTNSITVGGITVGDSHFIGNQTTYDNLLLQSSSEENIVLSSANDLYFNTGGSSPGAVGTVRIFVSGTDGNVGIGETDPGAKLHIKHNTADQLYLERTGGISGKFRLGVAGTNNTFYLTDQVQSVHRLVIKSNGTIQLPAYTAGLLTSDANGNISLDTSNYLTSYTETQTLDDVTDLGASTTNSITVGQVTIDKTADNTKIAFNSHSTLQGATAEIGVSREDFSTSKSHMSFYTNDGSGLNLAMRIKESGKVGIGTTNPQSVLHIQGDGSGILELTRNSGTPHIFFKNTSNTGYGRLYISDNVFQISTGTSTKALDFAWIEGDSNGNIAFPQYTAGILKTDANGNVSLDTSTYLTSVAFSDLTSTPTTIAGYGITDALELGTTATTALAGDTAIPVSGTDFDPVGTDNSTDVTLDTSSYDYLSISGQEITLGQIEYTTDIANTPTLGTAASSAATDFVAVSGDTMSGDLNFEDSNGNTRLTIGNITGSPYEATINSSNYHLVLQAKGTGQGQIRFNTGTTTATEKMRILENGNVGVGTTSPAAKMHIGPAALVSGYTTDRTTLAVSDTTNGAELILRGQSPRLWFDATAAGDGEIYMDGTNLVIYSGNPIAVGSSRLSIDSSGNIKFGAYTAGILQTDANGNVSLDTTTYIPTTDYDDFVNVGGDTMTGNLLLEDSVELRLGTDTDLKIYHDGTTGRIANNTGHLYIQNLSDDKDIYLRSDDGAGGLSTYLSIDGSDGLVNITKPLTLSNYGAGILKTNASGVVSVDTSAYLTSYTETQTLDDVTSLGATTTNNISVGTLTASGGGNTVVLKKGTGNPAMAFAGTSDEASALIEGISGGGLKIYTSNGGTLSSPSWSTQMTIEAGGNVGIGTTSPDSILHVSSTTPIITISNSDTSIVDGQVIGQLDFKSLDASTNMTDVFGSIRTEAQGTLDNGANDGGKMVFSTFKQSTTLVDQMVIDASGNVGIGTNSPTYKFEVSNGTQTGTFNPNSSGFVFLGSTSNHPLYFGVNDSIKAVILSNGNVGIGTTAPGEKLDVRGTIRSMKAQSSTAFTNPFLKLFPNATTNTTGLTSITLGTSPVDNYGVSLSGWRYGTGGTPKFIIKMHNNSASGLDALTVDSSGNVGIGTTSPFGKLNVTRAGINEGAISFDDQANNAHLVLAGSDALVRMQLGTYNNGSYGAWIQASYDNGSNNTGTEPLILNPQGGNVGIGTTDPAQKLDVVGRVRASYDANNYYEIGASSSGGFVVGKNGGTETVNIRTYGDSHFTGGNFGIGITSPLSKLHVDVDGSAARFSRSTAQYFDFNMDAANNNLDFYVGSNGKNVNLTMQGSYNGAMTLGTQGSESMRITSAGNVAIGTTTANTLLSIDGAADDGISIQGIGTTATRGFFGLDASGDGYFYLVNGGTFAKNIQLSSDLNVDNYIMGDLGVGTNTPGAKLDVDGTLRATDTATLSGDTINLVNENAGNNNINIGKRYDASTFLNFTRGGNIDVQLGVDSGENFLIKYNNTNLGASTVFYNNGTEVVRFKSNGDKTFTNGNVGIGTTDPTAPLHVVGNIYNQSGRVYTDAIQGYSANSITIGDGSQTFNLISRSDEDFAITGGNVGIGETSPATKLHVVGTAETRLRVGSSNASSNVVLELRDENTPTGQGTVITYNNSTGETYFNNALSTATTDFHFQSGEYGTANDFFTLSNSGGNSILHLKTTSGDSFITYEDSINELAVASDGDLRLTTPTDQDVFFISSGGNVDMTQAGGTVDMGGNLVVDGDITGNSNAYFDGNVGVGTSTPASTLSIKTTSTTADTFQIDAGSVRTHLLGAESSNGVIYLRNSSNSNYVRINAGGDSYFNGGNVGIGTTNPSYRLHVDNDSSNTNNAALYVRNPNSSSGAVIAEFVGDSDAIQIKNTNVGDYVIYNTQQSNGIALYDGNGGVEIHYNGATVLEADSNGGVKVTGQLSATGDVVAYSSDERLKENIKPIENAVDKIKQLKGVTFDWNEKSQELGFEPSTKTNDVGVIAQDVEAVFPQLVHLAPFDIGSDEEGKATSKTGEDYKTVNYARLTAVLIEAVKEQQQQIDELKEIINGFTK